MVASADSSDDKIHIVPPESLQVRNNINVPPQVLLTSHYSFYRDYCMNGLDLLDLQRMERLRNIRCIVVQGGMDLICPPDTALDLLEAWPTKTTTTIMKSDLGDFSNSIGGDGGGGGGARLELRIPLYAGHSMYDPFLTNELIRSTDRLADEWMRGMT
jgi:hypothetical protein